MHTYTCNICTFKTNHKNNYANHIKTNKHILKHKLHTQSDSKEMHDYKLINEHVVIEVSPNDNEVSNNLVTPLVTKNKYICEKCSNKFNDRSNLYRHKKKHCKGKHIVSSENNNEPLGELQNHIKSIGGLRDDLKYSLLNVLQEANTQTVLNSQYTYGNNNQSNNNINCNNNSNNNSNNNINNNNNNNISQSIVVNQFGKDDWSHVTDDQMFDMLKRPYSMISEAFKVVNLNNDVPQNHNVMALNKRDGRVKVMEPDGWFSKPKNDVLRDIVDEKYYTMDTFYNNMKDNKPEILKANMREDEIAAYDKFAKEFDNETNEENVNNPNMQPKMNQFKEDCFYSLNDFIYNLRIKRKMERKNAL